MAKRSETWFEHALRRSGWEPQRQVVALTVLGFVLTLLFGGLYLSQVVNEATTNRRLEGLLNQRDDLERENELLRVEIARLKSVPNLFQRAQAMGFEPVEASRIEYLVVPGYQPLRTDTVAPVTVTIVEDNTVYDETFADWISGQWHNLRQGIERLFGSS